MIRYPIFILGFMAAGKSSLAPKLARALGVKCIDLDQYVEHSVQQSIEQIFNSKGEEGFRRLEHQQLRTMKPGQKNVVALGGGTPAFEDNMRYVNATGTSIYLQQRPEILIGRLRQQKAQRPLLKGLNEAEIADFVKDLLAKRAPYYSQADYCIDGEKVKLKELIQLLNV
ncbi:MAG: shikimate kinase [Verrucomicrobia bacterium]|nr:shikimate kinase [Verrucomicrobiota bacterium]